MLSTVKSRHNTTRSTITYAGEEGFDSPFSLFFHLGMPAYPAWNDHARGSTCLPE
jgi:hypothetical protein